MATDADGRTISIGDNMLAAATVRRIEGDVLVLVTPDGRTIRASASQLLRVDDLVTRGNAHGPSGRYFVDNPPASSVAAAGPNDLARMTELDASQTLQTALFLSILGGYVPLAGLSTFTQGLMAKVSAAKWCEALGATYTAAQQTQGSDVGASSTAYHEVLSLTIPAGALGTKGTAEVMFELEAVTVTGNTKGRWLLNGATIWSNSGNALVAPSAQPYGIRGRASLSNDNSTAAQVGSWEARVSDDVSVTGYGGWLYGQNRGSGQFAATTVDSTAAMTLSFEVGFATSDAGHRFRRRSSRLLIHPAAA